MKEDPTEQQIREILKKHFPDREIKSISRINEGFTHWMYNCELEGKNVILRIGYNTKTDYTIKKELWVTEKYREVKIPVPEIYAEDTTRKEFPFEYLIMQKLPGQCLGKIWENLNIEEQKEIAFKIGQLMDKLHTIKFDKYGYIEYGGVKDDGQFSFREVKNSTELQWTAKLMDSGFRDLGGMVAQGLITPEQTSEIAKYLHKKIHLTKHAESVLIHGDLVLDHIFVEKENSEFKITGLCDLEFASAFAREFDFIKFHRAGLLYLEHFKNSLFLGYGKEKLHPQFDEVIRLYRMVRDIGFATYVAKAGNREVADKAVTNILKTVQEN